MISKEDAIKSIELLKANSTKRNFVQSVDVSINLKGLDIKKNEENVNFYEELPHKIKDVKVCGLIGTELLDSAKKYLDFYIHSDHFDKYAKDPKLIKKLAKDFDFFIAQANIMPKVASTFGKVLGPRSKMPDPKAGCIVPPNADLLTIKDKLGRTVRVRTNKSLTIHVKIGNENMSNEELADNLYSLLSHLIASLKAGENNIDSVYIKTTMGKPVKVI